ncbi:universal stress protein [Acaryochloris sp. IP29b_bin.148]|uniref:universal stress protein n=1 Tax=Acaryochloris sp. IP29b_bin.148 TaxID=2969218 RepID=UPI00263034F1|nr:universal stress protein [Acaryochloris sp. IP29b_bin.148]
MFHRIVVALDHSEAAISVFDQALDLAGMTQANLMLLHVLSIDDQDAPDTPTPFPSMYYYPGLSATSIKVYQQQWEKYTQTAQDILQAQADEAKLAGISVEFTQKQGSPGETICEVAKEWQADLILLGSRGRAGLSEWLLGSVSNYVMHHAPCSVLVSRETEAPPPNSIPDHLNQQLISNLAGWQ